MAFTLVSTILFHHPQAIYRLINIMWKGNYVFLLLQDSPLLLFPSRAHLFTEISNSYSKIADPFPIRPQLLHHNIPMRFKSQQHKNKQHDVLPSLNSLTLTQEVSVRLPLNFFERQTNIKSSLIGYPYACTKVPRIMIWKKKKLFLLVSLSS